MVEYISFRTNFYLVKDSEELLTTRRNILEILMKSRNIMKKNLF